VLHLNLTFFGRVDQLSAAYARIPTLMPFVLIMSVVAVTGIRIIGFLGARNLFFLRVGKYFRPVLERKVFLFLDIEAPRICWKSWAPPEHQSISVATSGNLIRPFDRVPRRNR